MIERLLRPAKAGLAMTVFIPGREEIVCLPALLTLISTYGNSYAQNDNSSEMLKPRQGRIDKFSISVVKQCVIPNLFRDLSVV